MRYIIHEVIQKECEAYQLIRLGVLVSVQEEVERLLPLAGLIGGSPFESPASFQHWREELLRHFYKQVGYAGFIKREAGSRSFRRFLFFRRLKVVERLREAYKKKTLDTDLAVPPHTLAFKLSSMLDDELYELEQPQIQLSRMPSDLDALCTSSCRNCFPIDLSTLLARLKKDDGGFWDTFYLTVKKLADIVTNKPDVPILYRKEVVQDTWSDVSMFLHDKIIGGELPAFETSLHFRHYIARVCLNKMRESIRKNSSQEVLPDTLVSIPDMDFLMENEEEKVDISMRAGMLDDIDVLNTEEVSRALTLILFDKIEPWYSLITQGVEEKTKLLFFHYVQGIPYEEIALRQADGLTKNDLKCLQAKLRQDAVRTRRLLKQRFMDLLKK